MTELQSLVGGVWTGGGAQAPDVNPARPADVVAQVRLADAAIARDAISAARSAFTGWRDTPAPARGEILRRAADLLDLRADEVGRDLAREEGKTLGEAVGETRRAVAILRYYAGQDTQRYPWLTTKSAQR